MRRLDDAVPETCELYQKLCYSDFTVIATNRDTISKRSVVEKSAQ
jgi:hypothetical protein